MIGVIADDLSGAAELGAVGLRHGLRAEVLLSGPPAPNAGLVCIDTDSRSCAPEEAARRSAAAARLLAAHGATLIYKKVDSVLRGRIAAEIDGILRELGLKRALLVPANPGRGRTIRDGHYFIQNTPIHETEFALDPEYPRTSPRVLELIGNIQGLETSTRTLNEPLPETGIAIPDISGPEDLIAWARRRPGDMLAAGAAEFFAATLAQAGLRPGTLPLSKTQSWDPPQREIFVCGSTSEASRQFIANAREQGTPVFSLPLAAAHPDFDPALLEPIARDASAALARFPRIVLCVDLPLIPDKSISKTLSSTLALLAQRVMHASSLLPAPRSALSPLSLFSEGGATAKELLRRMGWTRLGVLEEIAPGTATLGLEQAPNLRLTIKPGSYPWPARVIGSQ